MPRPAPTPHNKGASPVPLPPRAELTRLLTVQAGPLTLSLALGLPPHVSDEGAALLSLSPLSSSLFDLSAGAPLAGEGLREHLAILNALGLPHERLTASLQLAPDVQLFALEARCEGSDVMVALTLAAPDELVALAHLERLELCEACVGAEVFFSYARHARLSSPEHISAFVSALRAAPLSEQLAPERSVQLARHEYVAHASALDEAIERNPTSFKILHRLRSQGDHPEMHAILLLNLLCVGIIREQREGACADHDLGPHLLQLTPHDRLFIRIQRLRLLYLLTIYSDLRDVDFLSPAALSAGPQAAEPRSWELLLACAGLSVEELFALDLAEHSVFQRALVTLLGQHLAGFGLSPLGHRARLGALDDAELSEAWAVAQEGASPDMGSAAIWRAVANVAALTLWRDRGAWSLSTWTKFTMPILESLSTPQEDEAGDEVGSWLELRPRRSSLSHQRLMTEVCARQGLPAPGRGDGARSSRLTIAAAENIRALLNAYTLLLVERPAMAPMDREGFTIWLSARQRREAYRSRDAAQSAFGRRLARLLGARAKQARAFDISPIAAPWMSALLSSVTPTALQRALVALCHLSLNLRDQRSLCASYTLLQLITRQSAEAGGVEEVLAVHDEGATEGVRGVVEAWLRPERLHQLVALINERVGAPSDEPRFLFERPVRLTGDDVELPELIAWLCALRDEVTPAAQRLLRLALSFSLRGSA